MSIRGRRSWVCLGNFICVLNSIFISCFSKWFALEAVTSDLVACVGTCCYGFSCSFCFSSLTWGSAAFLGFMSLSLSFSNSLFSSRASVYIIPGRTGLFGGWDIDCFFLPCGFVEDCLVVLSYALCFPRFFRTFLTNGCWIFSKVFFFCVQWYTYYDDLHTSSLKV